MAIKKEFTATARLSLTSKKPSFPLILPSTLLMTEYQRCQNDGEDIGSDLWEADRVGYDPQTETYHAQHDWESDPSLSITAIETIAVATGCSPTTMEPLYSVIDPDALEALVSSVGEAKLQLQFTYDRWPVTVFSSGEIIVHDTT